MTTLWTAAAMPLAAPMLAAAFTGGCAAIHALRRHADRLTAALATLALCLGALALLAVCERQAANMPGAIDPPACYGFD